MEAIQTILFTGVNAGYSEKQAVIHEHPQALDATSKALALIKRSGGGDRNHYVTHPALVVYDRTLSCPIGGEIAVAVTTGGRLSSVTATAEKLRAHLHQSSLSVSGMPEEGQATATGLRIETAGNLATIARVWQEKATEIKNATMTSDNPHGTYVSVGIYEAGNGRIVIQGEANPRYFLTDAQRAAWKEAALDVAARVSTALGQPLDPEFRDLGFSYLRANDKTNSRGEKH